MVVKFIFEFFSFKNSFEIFLNNLKFKFTLKIIKFKFYSFKNSFKIKLFEFQMYVIVFLFLFFKFSLKFPKII